LKKRKNFDWRKKKGHIAGERGEKSQLLIKRTNGSGLTITGG